MANIGRNDPCPCGSGHKYKKCCLPRLTSSPPQNQSPWQLSEPPFGARPIPPTADYPEDDLDDLSNSVVDLIAAKQFDQALTACSRLLSEYPEVVDGLERSAMVHEALGNLDLAIDFYRRSLAFTQQPDQRDCFDEEGRAYFRTKLAELEARPPNFDTPPPSVTDLEQTQHN